MSRPKKKFEPFDNQFYVLAGDVTRAVEANKKDGTTQQTQVETLLDLEKKFKAAILKRSQSTMVYKKFLQLVCVKNRNILSARPYFRESAVNFSKKVTPAIKANDIEKLKTFDINYQLIVFIRKSWLGPFPKQAEQLFQKVHVAREKLIQNNVPLAIDRAKIFYRKTPKSHLSLLDMIGICALGLAAGIDKYCPPQGRYTPIFRSVCIGRMVGNLIDSYSETMLHFYPSDKRILYKAHTIRGRKGIEEVKELTKAVNKSFKEDAKEGKSIPKNEITVGELNSLMAASSTVSVDSAVNDEGFGIYHFTEDEGQDIEGAFIERESMVTMLDLIKELPLLHRKVLALKGIKV
jgi:DNA-directed RNA polymerase specialized sigma subunit